MSCSPARLAANRANALKSTGPRTAGGKEASRLNAYRHGLAGAGELLGPGEDAALVERRTGEFVEECGAVGAIGALLARRAAVLSVRMERAAQAGGVAADADVAAARAAFDDGRIDATLGWIQKLDAGHDPAEALAAIEASPVGREYLVERWEAIAAGLDAGDRALIEQAIDWLGLDVEGLTPASLAAAVAAALDRARGLHAASGPLAAAVAERGRRAGLLGWFDPDPDAERARRYEAAAERGMYRAMRALADLRRARGLPPMGPLAGAATPEPEPEPAIEAPPAEADPALGSFRAGDSPAAGRPPIPPAPAIEAPDAGRKRRPDLRKLGRGRR